MWPLIIYSEPLTNFQNYWIYKIVYNIYQSNANRVELIQMPNMKLFCDPIILVDNYISVQYFIGKSGHFPAVV